MVFSKNKYGVILEDDVIVSKNVYRHFSYLLEKYFNNDEFLSISSFNEFTNSEIESIYSIPVWRSWGWAFGLINGKVISISQKN